MLRSLSDRQLLEEIYIKLINIHNDIEKLNYKYLRIEEKMQQMSSHSNSVVVYGGGLSDKERKELESLRQEKVYNDHADYWRRVQADS